MAAAVAPPRKNLRASTNPDDSIGAHSSPYHLAFDIRAEKIGEYHQRLEAKGVPAAIVNYDHSSHQYSETVTEDTTGRSIYFMDPDGIVLELAT